MSLTVAPIPAFDAYGVNDLRSHLRYNGTRIAFGAESTYDGHVLSEVILVALTDDEGQNWYGVYDNDTLDDALVTHDFETACELMQSMADLIAPDGTWDFAQVAPSAGVKHK